MKDKRKEENENGETNRKTDRETAGKTDRHTTIDKYRTKMENRQERQAMRAKHGETE